MPKKENEKGPIKKTTKEELTEEEELDKLEKGQIIDPHLKEPGLRVREKIEKVKIKKKKTDP